MQGGYSDFLLSRCFINRCLTFADCRLQTADYRLQTAYSGPQTIDYKRRWLTTDRKSWRPQSLIRHKSLSHSRYSPVIKTENRNHSMKKSRVWDTINDWYISSLVKNQVSAVFHSRVICRSVSPKFIELCMETPEGHKHGSHKVRETSVTEFETENYCSRPPTHWKECFI